MAKKQSKKWNEEAVDDEAVNEEAVVDEVAVTEDSGDDDPTQRPVISRIPVPPKAEEVEAKDKVVETMECPQHVGFTINVLASSDNPKRRYAICTCQSRSNHWQGKVVWEHTDAK